MVDNFVLIRDLKDLTVPSDQDGFVAFFDAALRTARMAVGGDFRHALLCGAAGVGNIPAPLGRHGGHGKSRDKRETQYKLSHATLLGMVLVITTILQIGSSRRRKYTRSTRPPWRSWQEPRQT